MTAGHDRGSRCVKKICQWHIFSIRSRRLCRRSIHLDFHGTILTDNPPVSLALDSPLYTGGPFVARQFVCEFFMIFAFSPLKFRKSVV